MKLRLALLIALVVTGCGESAPQLLPKDLALKAIPLPAGFTWNDGVSIECAPPTYEGGKLRPSVPGTELPPGTTHVMIKGNLTVSDDLHSIFTLSQLRKVVRSGDIEEKLYARVREFCELYDRSDNITESGKAKVSDFPKLPENIAYVIYQKGSISAQLKFTAFPEGKSGWTYGGNTWAVNLPVDHPEVRRRNQPPDGKLKTSAQFPADTVIVDSPEWNDLLAKYKSSLDVLK